MSRLSSPCLTQPLACEPHVGVAGGRGEARRRKIDQRIEAARRLDLVLGVDARKPEVRRVSEGSNLAAELRAEWLRLLARK